MATIDDLFNPDGTAKLTDAQVRTLAPVSSQFKDMADLLEPLAPEPTLDDVLAGLPFAYLSGPAGTGKTWMARELVKQRDDAILAATTGIAAVNLGEATTINSLLSYFDTQSLLENYANGFLQYRLRALRRSGVRLIVLDEVSMLAADQLSVLCQAFDELDQKKSYDEDLQEVTWTANEDRQMKLLLVGDFAQLPPVNAGFAFESPEWSRFADHTFTLTTIRRQGDQEFVKALQAVRKGQPAVALPILTPQIVPSMDFNFPGTTIVAKNDAVDRINGIRHAKLAGKLLTYQTQRVGAQQKEWIKFIPEVCELKVGSLVMILANKPLPRLADEPLVSFDYVNGDLGTVLEQTPHGIKVFLHRTFEEKVITPVLKEWKEATGKKNPRWNIKGSVVYLPLRLAWATTVHKCVTYGTRIVVQGRGAIPIEEARIGDWVDTGQGEFARLKATAHTEKPVFRIRTARGYTVITSADHRWLVPDGEQETSNLRSGGTLRLMPPTLADGTEEVDRDLAWWIGATVGDGNYTNRTEGQLHFSNLDKVLRRTWMTIAQRLGGRPNTRSDERGCHMTSLPVRLRLEAQGLEYVGGIAKRIPAAVWRSGRTAWGACLQGLFDTDGSIDAHRLVFATRSEGLADDVQYLLLLLGIPSTRGQYTINTPGPYEGYQYWHIRVNAEGIDQFKALVGFRMPRKALALRNHCPNRRLRDFNGTDEIKEVQDLGVIAPVLDVELETIHTLSFNGILGSNSQGLSLDQVQVSVVDHMFAKPGMLYVALSRCRTLEGLRIVGNPKMIAGRCGVEPKIKGWL